MAKRTELKCPYCDTVQMRVKNCKEAEACSRALHLIWFSRLR